MADTVLAFDYGERYVGVAVGDTDTHLAHPAGYFEASSDQARLGRIAALVDEWRPTRLVLGLPLALDGGEHAMTARVRGFGKKLGARFGLPVDFADERLTSTAAEEMLRSAGRGGRGNKHKTHAAAAQLILQAHLDGLKRGLEHGMRRGARP